MEISAQKLERPAALGDREYLELLQCDLLEVFRSRHNLDVDAIYTDRADRNRFAAHEIGKTGARSILNIGGGGKRHLQSKLGNDFKVYEIDMTGDCDLKVNLDKVSRLPFEDSSFDACCAFDVLEHLENFHLINEELYRVAKDFVLISLPNSGAEIYYNAFRNIPQRRPDLDRGTFSKFYGLPLVPPEDRHRWWLYFQDIIRFYYWFSKKHGCSIEFWTPKLGLRKRIFKSIFGSHLYYTFFCQHVWIKMSKPGL